MAEVQAIFDSRCVSCHDKSKQGLPAFSQLSLIARDAHAALVNKAATEVCPPTSGLCAALARKIWGTLEAGPARLDLVGGERN